MPRRRASLGWFDIQIGFDVKIGFDWKCAAVVHGGMVRIQQVPIDLLQNAREAADPQPPGVTIATAAQCVRLRPSSGIGAPGSVLALR